jgi:hypothetical protein
MADYVAAAAAASHAGCFMPLAVLMLVLLRLLLLLLPPVPVASSDRTPSCAGASGGLGALCSSSEPPGSKATVALLPGGL